MQVKIANLHNTQALWIMVLQHCPCQFCPAYAVTACHHQIPAFFTFMIQSLSIQICFYLITICCITYRMSYSIFCQGLAYTAIMWYTTKTLNCPEVALWKKRKVYFRPEKTSDIFRHIRQWKAFRQEPEQTRQYPAAQSYRCFSHLVCPWLKNK